MSVAAKRRPATLADLLAIPEEERFHEIIDGELVQKAMPSFRHGGAQGGLVTRISGRYGRRPGGPGPGGWRFATETEIELGAHEIYRPDVAGWRRERMPSIPDESPITLRPDWVCEILSPTNASNDLFKKLRVYQDAQVPHYWIIDPVAESLVVYRWTKEGYLVVAVAKGDEAVHAEPFEEVSFSVRGLIDGDD